jgi:hypothetical protein
MPVFHLFRNRVEPSFEVPLWDDRFEHQAEEDILRKLSAGIIANLQSLKLNTNWGSNLVSRRLSEAQLLQHFKCHGVVELKLVRKVQFSEFCHAL